MTTPTPPPYNPGGPVGPVGPAIVWPPQQVEPAPKKRNRLWLILAAVVALIVVIGGTVAFTLAATGRDNTGAQSDGTKVERITAPGVGEPTSGTLPDYSDAQPTTAVPVAPVITPKAADFELTLKTIDKQCFGSAGCNVTVQVEAGWPTGLLHSDDTWLVIYEVKGDEDGPIVGSFEVTGSTFQVNEESLSTKSSKTKVTVKATDVEKVGI